MSGEAKEAELVPKMQGDILLSTGKLAKKGYVSVYDRYEVNIYDAIPTDIEINGKVIPTRYFSKKTRMWKTPLKDKVKRQDNQHFGCKPPQHSTHHFKCV